MQSSFIVRARLEFIAVAMNKDFRNKRAFSDQ